MYCAMMYGLLLLCVGDCVRLKHACVSLVVFCGVGWFVVVCVSVCVCVLLLFNVCGLFVNAVNGVVWFARVYYCVCLSVWLLFKVCALCVAYCVML